MADGNGATGNKQIVGWVITALGAAVMVLFQFAILNRLEALDSHTTILDERAGRIETAVGSLQTGRIDDDNKLESLTTEVGEVRNAFERSQQQKVNDLETDLRAKRLARKHDDEHSKREVKALTDELVKKAVMNADP